MDPLERITIDPDICHGKPTIPGRDHAPPHFHAYYGEYDITVSIADGVVTGRFPRRALQHVLEWYEFHKDELEANWTRASRFEPLLAIAPLE